MIAFARLAAPTLLIASTACRAGTERPASARGDEQPRPGLVGSGAGVAPTASTAPAAAPAALAKVELPDVGRFPLDLHAIEGTLVGTVRYADAENRHARRSRSSC